MVFFSIVAEPGACAKGGGHQLEADVITLLYQFKDLHCLGHDLFTDAVAGE